MAGYKALYTQAEALYSHHFRRDWWISLLLRCAAIHPCRPPTRRSTELRRREIFFSAKRIEEEEGEEGYKQRR